MNKLKFLGLLLIVLLSLNAIAKNDLLEDHIRFATLEEGKKLITTEDEYTKNWSPFDIDSRSKKRNSTKEHLLDVMANNVLPWEEVEIIELKKILKEISESIEKQNFKLDFPDEIFFIKTTGKEEGGADGYTRLNYVVLKQPTLSGFTNFSKKTIIHELYHILSRHNKNFRFAMYDLIGFKRMNPVAYPDKIKDFKISNPDATQTDSYITVKFKRKPINCMMIMYSKRKYTSGSFFSYITLGLLKLCGEEVKEAELKNGVPKIYKLNEISDFFEQIGRNTPYILHPEEILAENFIFAVMNKKDLPNPELVKKMQEALKKQYN